MDNLGEKLQSLLSDPKSMEAVMQVAKSLGQSVGAQEQEAQSAEPKVEEKTEETKAKETGAAFPFPAILHMLDQGKGDRGAVLRAIRPYVEDKKRTKLDQVMKTMQSVELLLQAKDLF